MSLRIRNTKIKYLFDLLSRDYRGSLYFYSFNPHTKEKVDRVIENRDGVLDCRIVSGKDFFVVEGVLDVDCFTRFLKHNKVYWDRVELSSQTFSEFMFLFAPEAVLFETHTGQRLARYVF